MNVFLIAICASGLTTECLRCFTRYVSRSEFCVHLALEHYLDSLVPADDLAAMADDGTGDDDGEPKNVKVCMFQCESGG